MNRLCDQAGNVLQQSPDVLLRNWRFFGTSVFTVRPNPPLQLFLLPFPAFFLLPARVYAAFLIRNTDKYWCVEGFCYDIFIVCVHGGDVNITLPFIILSMQRWSASQVEFSDLCDIGDLLPWSTERLIHDECTFVQQTEWGFLSFAPFSSCLFSRYSFLSDLLATTHPTFLPLFTFSPRSLFNQSSFFIL